MDSDSGGASDVSDDGDMVIPSAQASATPSAPASRWGTPKVDKIPRKISEPAAQLNLNPVPATINPISVDDSDDSDDYLVEDIGPRPSDTIELMKRQLVNELSQLKRYASREDDITIIAPPVERHVEEQRGEGDFLLVFELPDGSECERILRRGQQLVDLIKDSFPDLENCRISIDGVVTDAENVITDLLQDYMKIKLEKTAVMDTEGHMRLSFSFPDGTKKKLCVESSQTFGDILRKLEIPNARLFFDGYELNKNQRICDNDEIEDEEQIDVKC